MLSPSLLTPGSKCMHGRSEIKAQQNDNFHLLGWIKSSFVPFVSSTCVPSTLTLYHVDLLSPCTQSSQLEKSHVV